MPAVNVTTTAATAFTVPDGAFGYSLYNNSDTTILYREGATVATSGANMGNPIAAGEHQEFGFDLALQNPVAINAIHSGSGNKVLVYDIIKTERIAVAVT